MSGLETNLKSTRPRPGHYETQTRDRQQKVKTETLKIGLETFITAYYINSYRNLIIIMEKAAAFCERAVGRKT